MSADKTRVTFKVTCFTEDTERVVIAGSGLDLGGWDPQHRGLKLSQNKNVKDEWSASVFLKTGRPYEYKYYIVSKEDSDTGPLFFKSTSARTKGETFEGNRKMFTQGRAMVINDGEFNDPPPDSDEGRIELVDHVDDPWASPLIVVLYRLPIIAKRDTSGAWTFSWDDDALYLTCSGFRHGMTNRTLLWVGILNTDVVIPEDEQTSIRKELFERFKCYPLFIPKSTLDNFYQGFCKGVLWPIFHTVNKVTGPDGQTVEFDDTLWQVYNEVNALFSKAVAELYKEGNMVWIHDYHLMVLPAYLRKQLSGAPHIGFFLHTPWPSSEVFRMLPFRDNLLHGMLSASLIGFNLFDYARHFLSACVRLLNVQQEASRRTIGLSYGGRHVAIRVSHIGIYPPRFTDAIATPSVKRIESELREKFQGRFVLGAIDDLDYIKGISLKLEAFEKLLYEYTLYRDKVVLYQVALPKTARVQESVRDEIREHVKRINDKFGSEGKKPVEYVESDIPFDNRVALYRVTDALFLTPIRDGLNLIPYEYLVCTEDLSCGQLILSEFIGCSKALSSAVRLNPWSAQDLVLCIDKVIQREPEERKSLHDADIKFVKTHTTEKWAESFLKDLVEANEPLQKVTYLGLGVGLGKRLVEFAGFSRLSSAEVIKAYRASHKRLFLLDYDGTLTTSTCSSRMEHAWARTPEKAHGHLQKLAEDHRNTIYIMSGRTRNTLESNFGKVRALGIAAEHGFYYREPFQSEWKTQETFENVDRNWIETVYKIMQAYTRRTDGSYIEKKSVGLVWHYLDADPEFGNWQAKEMASHLNSLLDHSKVEVVAGYGWVQVRFKNLNKGSMVQRILSAESMLQQPDFVLCVGDDRTDEDMFRVLDESLSLSKSTIFTCTVGIQPSRARYYLRHSDEVVGLLGSLTMNELRSSVSTPEEINKARLTVT